MGERVTTMAKSDEIFFSVGARMAAKLLVMNLQVRHRPAGLASPAIATEHQLSQTLIRDRV